MLQVNTNGVVSFGAAVTDYTADPFPLTGSPMLTPYWGDVDTRGDGAGEIRYLQSNDPTLLSVARNDVLEVYPSFTFFNPTSLLIATWDHVGHYNSVSDFTGLVGHLLRADSYTLKHLFSDRPIHFSVS